MQAPVRPLAYPSDRQADVVLRDGSTIHVRPIRDHDGDRILAFLRGVSRESIVFRFFGAANIEWATNWSLDVDYADRFGLVAETGPSHTIVAHAAYVRMDPARAEVAFLVADAWQGRGISTILLAHLAEVAQRHGIATFVAEVLPSNRRMIQVFRDSGFTVETRSTPDAIEIEFPTSIAPAAAERFQERDRLASVAAVGRVLAPRSVAVIGASRKRGTIGGELLHNVITSNFKGAIYAINEHGGSVQSLAAYRSPSELPEPVDLAVVAVPARRVLETARACAVAGVRALVVVSAGFAEVGEDGARRQTELVGICRESGMRLVGPNCLGVLNTAVNASLNATFVPHEATPGRIGFLSQSGGLGIAIIEAARRLGIGLSSFVSVGNKADLSGNDFLQYWEQDATTDVALLYLESFGNPRKFARIARRFARTKPVIAVKSGRSPAGLRGAASHTGALLAASDVTVDALFRHAGVIRTDTLAEMFDVAMLLAKQPVPRGDRLAIVTNAGGPGIVCADACQAAGVEVPEPPTDLAAELARDLPKTASVGNPVDMIATASAEDYRRTLTAVIASGAFDAVLAIFVPPLVTAATEVATVIAEVSATAGPCAVAAVFMTAEGPPAELVSGPIAVPGYQFPEDAARAIAHAARYGRWRSRPAGVALSLPQTSVDRATAIISRELGSGGGWMQPRGVAELFACYGIPQAPSQLVTDAEDAVRAAAEIAAPVALKAVARGLVHKREVGAVELDLKSPDEVRQAAAKISGSVTEAGYALTGFEVQPMVSDGVELLVGVVHDPSFGPILACGAGGTNAELIRDVAVRITPVTDMDAEEMLRELKIFPLLGGYRGSIPCDVNAVEEVVLRISAMVEAHPEIVELDCNPLLARTDGAVVLDARVRVEPGGPSTPVPSVGR